MKVTRLNGNLGGTYTDVFVVHFALLNTCRIIFWFFLLARYGLEVWRRMGGYRNTTSKLVAYYRYIRWSRFFWWSSDHFVAWLGALLMVQSCKLKRSGIVLSGRMIFGSIMLHNLILPVVNWLRVWEKSTNRIPRILERWKQRKGVSTASRVNCFKLVSPCCVCAGGGEV